MGEKMKVCGVICEFNPFHNGHKHLIDELRQAGAGLIVCLMSGSFVQRGEPAIADKFTRAACAVAGGADVVLELPFPYCMSSAEFFARAGVDILDRLGVDMLGFGCESGDAESLRRAAKVLLAPDFSEQYRKLCRAGRGSAGAFFEVYRSLAGEELSDAPNNILAVNYVKELMRRKSNAEVAVIRRSGCGYNETSVRQGQYPSARALRKIIQKSANDGRDGVGEIADLVPPETINMLSRAVKQGTFASQIENIQHDIITYLRISDCDLLMAAADADDGLAARLCAAAREAGDYAGLVCAASAANYTDARVRRAVINMMLGITPDDLRREEAYVQLLAANVHGREWLSARRNSGGVEIVTKPADAAGVQGGERQWMLSQRSEALWCMTLPRVLPAAYLTRNHPVFL